jgi:hypothetical protein
MAFNVDHFKVIKILKSYSSIQENLEKVMSFHQNQHSWQGHFVTSCSTFSHESCVPISCA